MENISYICECGQQLGEGIYAPYRTVSYDREGNIIYAVCSHGITVIDNRDKIEAEDLLYREFKKRIWAR